ncbi:putative bifunctional diguanylate cyclase/phosphodiesterase [Pelagibacterium lacus]|uniref:Bifunctional diguanylate cyclase/phosphodiesterase n=1 Tax=Pelagibacterium lacus TaxID=2282655 RepID=A0A369W438_9HYPH|nr:bifunctional diguanylate cyclase/phosphodiesterase [Pelagibacterium lacus]RDE08090.1 bifunctional diguanylate cyclase/phosphodiesterase [Pelagibacterium lacus]
MRTELSLTNILAVYRGTALAAGSVAVAIMGAAGAGLAALALEGDYVPAALVGAGLLGLALLGIVVLGYFSLRHALLLAEKQRRDLLDSLNRDALTGALTRKYFLDRLREMVRQCDSQPVAYVQIDMDHLKAINDGSGHAAGDQALVRLARALAELMPGAVIGRLGGDEFGLALPGVTSKAALRRLGERLLEELDRPRPLAGRDMRLSASLGIALAPEDAGDADTLISKADLALYKGKNNGRGAVVAFDRELLTEERHQRFVERELRAAILMDELELYYQPVRTVDGGLRSVEALLRWRHSVRGMISPAAFVPIAEQSDLIGKLGQWVLRRACADFPLLGVPAVAVNVSAAELRNPDYAAHFAEEIANAGLPGENFIVEITETAPLQKNSAERKNLEFLRALGVRIAVDDFGAGHASLGYLRDLSFDIIKIDRAYVAEITSRPVDSMIVQSICRIAADLGVAVIAEGVETPEQHAVLAELGCTGFQGFLLGRPEPLETILAAEGRAVAAA